jgi:hypothetical protein
MVHYYSILLLSCVNGDAPRLGNGCGVLDGTRVGNENLKKLLD